jgi:cyclase
MSQPSENDAPRPRIIPVLLLRGGGLCKSRGFGHERYIGDPLNTARIFNEKEADELIFLDIDATINQRHPDLDRLRDIATECFMPVCYGGGITSVGQIEAILRLGIEKVCLGASALLDPALVREAARAFGSQSIVVCLDVRRSWWRGECLVVHRGAKRVPGRFEDHLRRIEDLGAGEAIVQSVDRDGSMSGYDLDLIRRASACVRLPLVALGGAGRLDDLREALAAGASAAAAGSLFVFHGPHRAVLISYPDPGQIAGLPQMGRP